MSEAVYGVVAVGNALVDVLAPATDDFIASQKASHGMEKGAIEALIYADDATRLQRALTVQAIRSFRQDLSESLNTHEPKAAPA